MGMRNFASRAFRVLLESQCEQITQASLKVLERTGVRFFDPVAVATLRSGGARVSDENLVRLPPDLVRWAIDAAPSEVTVHDRSGAPVLHLGGRDVYFGTGSDCTNILDSFSGERRLFQRGDVEQGIRLVDGLANLDFVLSIGLISDAPTMSSDVHQFDAMVRNTRKPVVFTTHSLENARTIVEMAEVVAGGAERLLSAPAVVHFAEVDCPLKYAQETCLKLMFLAEKGVPVIQGAGPMMGATGPQTHAGVLALANAETLAGNVLLQLTRRGSPFICGLGIHPLNMRTGVLPYGAPELSLNTAAAADLAHYLGLPTWGYAGCTDAKVVDQQAAMEATASVIMSLLSGANLVHDVGYVESGLASSFEMIVLTDTVIEMGRAMLKDIDVDDETLALDVIDAVGQRGNYLAEDHTLRHFREVWYSDLVDRQTHSGWVAAGRPTMGDRLASRVRELVEGHAVEALPPSADEALARLLAEADRRAEAQPSS
jgi:trimethylamine---corrinoid protein Co-methyltransferase